MATIKRTIEEKAKAYDEARKVAENIHRFSSDLDEIKRMEQLFPELKESEDERIRKKIIATIHLYYGEPLEDEAKEMIDWLEKQGEQTSDKVIVEEKPLLEKFKQAVYDCAWGKVTCKEEGETEEEYANRWAEHFLLIVKDWADDYIDFTIQQKLRNSYEKGKTDVIEKQGEQKPQRMVSAEAKEAMYNKPAWSKEDERIHNRICGIIHHAAFANYDVDENGNELGEYAKIIGWFKSIKDRVLPQPKQEWSEEDEDILNTIINHFKVDIECTDEDDTVRWLKSLRPQTTWKPSEEQIDALEDAIADAVSSIQKNMLNSLYQDIKKLKGE